MCAIGRRRREDESEVYGIHWFIYIFPRGSFERKSVNFCISSSFRNQEPESSGRSIDKHLAETDTVTIKYDRGAFGWGKTWEALRLAWLGAWRWTWFGAWYD